MIILAIDTSCDETAVAITEERKVLANAMYSQILMHTKWGGVMPSLAKRAHQERIDGVINKALKKSRFSWETIDYIAVTYGPGLAIALEVGIAKAKELALTHHKKIIPVNHMEGHIYSSFVQNSEGNPKRDFEFPYLALLISGGHTEIVMFKEHLDYQVLGSTRDDAAGEALDKAARMLGFNYPGGVVIERLSADVHNEDVYKFPRPMRQSKDLDFSFSGLKTSFLYYLKELKEEEKNEKIKYLASSFQEAVFDSIIIKLELAIKQTGIHQIVVGGGVIANMYLRKRLRNLVKKYSGSVYFPPYKYLTQDNAAMIGVAAFYKAQKGLIFDTTEKLDRVPRLSFKSF